LLVTGGAGFIGSNFIRYWIKNHITDQILNLDKLTYAGNLENLADIEDNQNYRFIKGDICNSKLVGKLMKGIDIVVHFAAESHVDNSITGSDVFVRTNIVGTHVLLKSALKNKIKRFHHVSTDEVFGALGLDDKNKFNELTLYQPSSPYSASKAGSDHLVRAYFKTYGLPVTISNCSNNYGPYQHIEKFIPISIISLLKCMKVPVYGDGLYVRDWLYIEDHCRAIDLILQKGKVGETYCIGGMTDDVSNLEIVKKIIKILGKDESFIEHVKDRPGHDRRYAVDWSKIKRELGYSPRFDLNKYLEQTVRWYEENRAWWNK